MIISGERFVSGEHLYSFWLISGFGARCARTVGFLILQVREGFSHINLGVLVCACFAVCVA